MNFKKEFAYQGSKILRLSSYSVLMVLGFSISILMQIGIIASMDALHLLQMSSEGFDIVFVFGVLAPVANLFAICICTVFFVLPLIRGKSFSFGKKFYFCYCLMFLTLGIYLSMEDSSAVAPCLEVATEVAKDTPINIVEEIPQEKGGSFFSYKNLGIAVVCAFLIGGVYFGVDPSSALEVAGVAAAAAGGGGGGGAGIAAAGGGAGIAAAGGGAGVAAAGGVAAGTCAAAGVAAGTCAAAGASAGTCAAVAVAPLGLEVINLLAIGSEAFVLASAVTAAVATASAASLALMPLVESLVLIEVILEPSIVVAAEETARLLSQDLGLLDVTQRSIFDLVVDRGLNYHHRIMEALNDPLVREQISRLLSLDEHGEARIDLPQEVLRSTAERSMGHLTYYSQYWRMDLVLLSISATRLSLLGLMSQATITEVLPQIAFAAYTLLQLPTIVTMLMRHDLYDLVSSLVVDMGAWADATEFLDSYGTQEGLSRFRGVLNGDSRGTSADVSPDAQRGTDRFRQTLQTRSVGLDLRTSINDSYVLSMALSAVLRALMAQGIHYRF